MIEQGLFPRTQTGGDGVFIQWGHHEGIRLNVRHAVGRPAITGVMQAARDAGVLQEQPPFEIVRDVRLLADVS